MTGQLPRIIMDALQDGFPIASTTGEQLRRIDLMMRADRIADALQARGVARDEPVHVHIGNRPSDLAALLGVWLAGAVAVPVHVTAAPATVDRLQRRTRSRLLVDDGRVETIALEAPPARPLLRDAAVVIFTSGSTGEPKGVVVGHEPFAEKLVALDRLLGLSLADQVLVPLQLTFIFGLWVSLLAILKGAQLVLMPRFSREAAERAIDVATVLAGVPSMFRALLARPELPESGLRVILTGGEVLPPRLAEDMGRLAPQVFDLYGLTETGSCDFCLAPADQPAGFGSIGTPTERVAFRIAQDGAAWS